MDETQLKIARRRGQAEIRGLLMANHLEQMRGKAGVSAICVCGAGGGSTAACLEYKRLLKDSAENEVYRAHQQSNNSSNSNSSVNSPEIPESCSTPSEARRDYETALRFWNESAASGYISDVSILKVLRKWEAKAESSEQ